MVRVRIVVVVVVVVFTLTDRASTIPSNIRGCQSGTWSQGGTKVNGSHHGDNPLLRPTGIQIATKSYATLQAMAPTNSKTVHQTSFTPYHGRLHEYIVTTMFDDVLFCFRCFVLVSLHGDYVSVQYNGGLLPDIIQLTQCYYHRGTRLNAMKRFFCICSL